MTLLRSIAAGIALVALASQTTAAAERDPGPAVFSEPSRVAPDSPGLDDAPSGKAAQWVDAPRAAPVNAGKRPISYGGLLIAYHDGEPVETCLGQFVGPNVILTSAGCVTNGKGKPWSGPFELYQGYSDREYDRLYVAKCATVYGNWKGEKGKDYYFDYALLYSKKSSRTGHYVLKSPPVSGALKLYDMQKRRPVAIDGKLAVEDAGVTRFKPKDKADTAESRGGAWILRYSTEESSTDNRVSSITSHVDKDGVVFGPVFDRSVRDLYDIAAEGCPEQ